MLPTRVVDLIDRARRRTLQTKAGYVRAAVLDKLQREGLLKIERLSDGSIYAIDLDEVLA